MNAALYRLAIADITENAAQPGGEEDLELVARAMVDALTDEDVQVIEDHARQLAADYGINGQGGKA